ncbi:hypothetical protein HYT56_02140 [Candidatus Woesearchaeota archaeon]|nr:hypothetical protein [Candidatus Woesearchaeota archaeon]
MSETEKDILKRIDSKLGALIALEMVEDKPNTNREKIKLLSDLGLSYNEIASILNVKPGYVSKEKALLKKKNG